MQLYVLKREEVTKTAENFVEKKFAALVVAAAHQGSLESNLI